MSPVAKGEDGLARCAWCLSTPDYQSYHDDEWGRPVGDENRVYEKLCLEGFQAGLSWLTILRKRAAFRDAFASFDPAAVAVYGEGDVERLMSDASIVRNRAKILAAIGNAKATLALHDRQTSLAALLWEHEPARKKAPKSDESVPPSTPESKALSAALIKNGFRFVGPTTVYAAMQSLGVVNDHLGGCAFRKACESERDAFTPPE